MTIPRALLLTLTTFLAACQMTQPASDGNSKGLLTGPEWQVKSIEGEKVIEDSRVTLHFTEDGKVHGRTGCNLYNGGYQMTGEGLRTNTLTQTRMTCAPSVMKQEQKFLEILASARRFRVEDSGTLVLEGGGGRTLESVRR